MRRIIFLPILFSLFLLALVFPQSAIAAKLILNPLSKTINVGQEFDVSINLDTQGKEVRVVQAKLSFDKNLIEVIKVNFQTIFSANVQNINNNDGFVQLGSNPESPETFTGNSLWLTLRLKGKAKGTADLRFDCSESGILEAVTLSNLLDCGSLSAGSYTITEESQPQPTATPTPEPGGNGGQPGPGCTDLSPSTPTNLGAASGPGNGEVTLTWTKVSADYYSLVFGGASRAYQYGAPNIGDTNQYVVRQLASGKLYYFAIAAVKGCASSGFSNEASARAKGVTGGTPAKVTPKTSPKPTPTPPYQPIGEILPEVDFPTEEEVVTPTPIPIFEPEEGKPSPFRTTLLILLFLAILSGLGFGFWKLIKGKMPPPPPKIVIPEGPTPTEPTLPPQEQA